MTQNACIKNGYQEQTENCSILVTPTMFGYIIVAQKPTDPEPYRVGITETIDEAVSLCKFVSALHDVEDKRLEINEDLVNRIDDAFPNSI